MTPPTAHLDPGPTRPRCGRWQARWGIGPCPVPRRSPPPPRHRRCATAPAKPGVQNPARRRPGRRGWRRRRRWRRRDRDHRPSRRSCGRARIATGSTPRSPDGSSRPAAIRCRCASAGSGAGRTAPRAGSRSPRRPASRASASPPG